MFRIVLLVLTVQQLLTGIITAKTCDETFCGELRKSPEGYPSYYLDLSTVVVVPDILQGVLHSEDGTQFLVLTIVYFLPTRYEVIITRDVNLVPSSLNLDILKNTETNSLTVERITNESIVIAKGDAKTIVYSKPFKIESYFENKLVTVINGKGRLVALYNASAVDVTFQGAQEAYGIPLHADNLALRTTTDGKTDPYRLYNINSGPYKLKSTEALHTSAPILFTHGKSQSAGILWADYSQKWVDVTHTDNEIETYWMNETPVIVVVLFNGPTIEKAMQQVRLFVHHLPNLPQYNFLGYHQSRNSYGNEKEVLDVIDNFNANNLPLDSIWLDSNYTDNGKYFTWDATKFPNPVNLQNQLATENRSLVITIGPHIKVEKGYFVHDEAASKGYYVRNPDGSDYVGQCLPGDSSFLNLVEYNATLFYRSLFYLDDFKNKNLHFFIDLNEPTVFENEKYENTLAPDLLHMISGNSLPHWNIHNAYGAMQVAETFIALKQANETVVRLERPLIATRSHTFIDTNIGPQIIQDNPANWEHLQISIPMCLSLSVTGGDMCGVNIGGFYGVPDEELYQRWFQAGAWLSFYRSHFPANVPPREPYVYSEEVKARVRKAMYQRYAHLPIWYTLFWETIIYNRPVVRPLFYHYPQEEAVFKTDQQLLVGADILVAPVLKRGAFIVSVYLPGGESEIWYNIDDNYKSFRGTGLQIVYVSLDSIPVFYRGGSIIARKNVPRLTAAATVNDPYTLYICLNTTNGATGTLYVDDYKSYDYETLKFLYVGFSFSDNSFYAYKIIKDADYDGAARISEIVIVNAPKNIVSVHLNIGNKIKDNTAAITYSNNGTVLKISNLSLNLREPFMLRLL